MTRLLLGSLQTIQPHAAGVMSGQKRKRAAGRRLKPLSPSTSHPSHCSRKKRSLFLFSTKSRHLFNVFLSAGPIPLRIREARVPIVNDNECVRKINTVTEKIFILPASSFCAGGIKGHDACQVMQYITYHIKFRQYIDILSSSIENFPTFCVAFSFKAPLKTPALTVLIHRVMAGVR